MTTAKSPQQIAHEASVAYNDIASQIQNISLTLLLAHEMEAGPAEKTITSAIHETEAAIARLNDGIQFLNS